MAAAGPRAVETTANFLAERYREIGATPVALRCTRATFAISSGLDPRAGPGASLLRRLEMSPTSCRRGSPSLPRLPTACCDLRHTATAGIRGNMLAKSLRLKTSRASLLRRPPQAPVPRLANRKGKTTCLQETSVARLGSSRASAPQRSARNGEAKPLCKSARLICAQAGAPRE